MTLNEPDLEFKVVEAVPQFSFRESAITRQRHGASERVQLGTNVFVDSSHDGSSFCCIPHVMRSTLLALAALLPAPSQFLDLVHDASVRWDPTNANRGTCAADYAGGRYHTHWKWSKFKWLDREMLQVNISDRTYATDMSTHTSGSWDIDFGNAGDCYGGHSSRSEIVLDLRETAFKIADAEGACSKTGTGSATNTCGQWRMAGWYPKLTMSCTDNDQRCVINCGGSAGHCWIAAGYLQLTPGPTPVPTPVPSTSLEHIFLEYVCSAEIISSP